MLEKLQSSNIQIKALDKKKKKKEKVLNANELNVVMESFDNIIDALLDKHTPYQSATKKYIF